MMLSRMMHVWPCESQMPLPLAAPLRLMLVESHPYLRARIHQLLEAEGAFSIIADCASGLQAVTDALRLQPDLILTDLRLDDSNGLALARVIARLMPEILVVLIDGRPSYRQAARESGVREVVARDDLSAGLISALNRVRDSRCKLAAP